MTNRETIIRFCYIDILETKADINDIMVYTYRDGTQLSYVDHTIDVEILMLNHHDLFENSIPFTKWLEAI